MNDCDKVVKLKPNPIFKFYKIGKYNRHECTFRETNNCLTQIIITITIMQVLSEDLSQELFSKLAGIWR